MGTASESMSVALSALFWCGWMLLWDFPRRSEAHIKPGLSFLSVLGLAFASLGSVVWRRFTGEHFAGLLSSFLSPLSWAPQF